MDKNITNQNAETGTTTAKQERYEKKMAKYRANKARKEQKENSVSSEVTATTTAKQNERKRVENGVKTNKSQLVIIPGHHLGKTFYINERSVIYVKDVAKQQNSTLFEQGLKLIDSKVTPKRRSYLSMLLRVVLPTTGMGMEDMIKKSCERHVGNIIALVCDIALHNNKKLAHPQAYHKDFNKYVANLFCEYNLDVAYNTYIQVGDDNFVSVPEPFISPDMYKLVSAIA